MQFIKNEPTQFMRALSWPCGHDGTSILKITKAGQILVDNKVDPN
ncbi:Uncharacterised protein [Shewanella baltica]|nr:Uncharacterised protein [Shewanella baltica]